VSNGTERLTAVEGLAVNMAALHAESGKTDIL
jgi:hypothetical protein